MKKYQIFIDGQAGTTGLQIRQRLASHPQIEVVTICLLYTSDAADE